jgi:rhamnogalacturonyl hydrolase YesR
MLAALVAFALLPFGHDHYVSDDGAWCWFADPRAVWYDNRIAAGFVTSSGDIQVNLYDPAAKKKQAFVLAKSFEKDDHANPALIQLPNGRLAAFYSKHNGADMWLSTFNGSVWTESRKINPNDPDYKGPKGSSNRYTYPNPQLLSKEHNRVYLFWRGLNWKPTFSWSDDLGKSWAKGKMIVSVANEDTNNRPYFKVAGDGQSRIHMVFTDGHPRNEPLNSLYYVRYEKGAFRDIQGKPIAKINQLPFTPDKANVVYDGRTENIRCWVWDLALDASGNPVVVYSRLPKESEHFYRYAWWNGKRWVDRPIVFGGSWFPQTPAGSTEKEPHYSGGVTLDPNDPRFVYLSRPVNGRYEIERWFTADGGNTWSHVAITDSSKHDSVRPFVIRGKRPTETGPFAIWMNFTKYVHYTDFRGSLQAANEDRGPFDAKTPMRTATAVWRWVRSNPSRWDPWEWTVAPLYSGVFDYAVYAKDEQALDWVRIQGASNGWKMGPRASMADDVAVGQAFLSLYEIDRDPAQLEPIKKWMDGFVLLPHTRSLEWKGGVGNEELAWCDSLYMAPPTMTMLSRLTGDPKYADKMVELWEKTSDYLYDPAEKLFTRDSSYFKKREANGKKVFWSRGNGWVLAGLAKVLQNLPASHPGYAKLRAQFVEMSSRIASLQTKDGTWHASLLDPESYPMPETSGTGFFVYGLAWGINAGVLDRATFEPVVLRGFSALTDTVDPNGRLMWVQPVGADPRKVKASDTDSYGVGAFLMAAAQVDRMMRDK